MISARHSALAAISAITPVTWLSGTQATVRVAAVRPRQASKFIDECTMPRLVSIAPLGFPVVPDVYRMAATSLLGRRRCRDRRAGKDDVVVHKQLRPAMPHDVLDAGLLLAHADRHRDRAQPGGAEEGERKFDAVAEQDADPVAGSDAAPGQGAGGLRHPFAQRPPGEPGLAADQRLAAGIACRGLFSIATSPGGRGVAKRRPFKWRSARRAGTRWSTF